VVCSSSSLFTTFVEEFTELECTATGDESNAAVVLVVVEEEEGEERGGGGAGISTVTVLVFSRTPRKQPSKSDAIQSSVAPLSGKWFGCSDQRNKTLKGN
jgi:hypothetical protein